MPKRKYVIIKQKYVPKRSGADMSQKLLELLHVERPSIRIKLTGVLRSRVADLQAGIQNEILGVRFIHEGLTLIVVLTSPAEYHDAYIKVGKIVTAVARS